MGVEAARLALRARRRRPADALWFATANPAYLDKTNATAIHAALRLDTDAPRDGRRRRGPLGRRRAARRARRPRPALVVAADMRTGLPTSADEAAGRRRRGRRPRRRRRRRPGDRRATSARRRPPRSSSTAGARRATPLEAVGGAVRRDQVHPARRAGVERGAQGRRAHARRRSTARSSPARTRGPSARSPAGSASPRSVVDDLAARSATPAPPTPRCCSPTRSRRPSRARSSRWSSLADGADVLLFRTTDAIASYTPARPVAARSSRRRRSPTASSSPGAGSITLEPPRRPEPDRISASAAGRTEDWKYGFVGSRDRVDAARCTCRPRGSRMMGGAVDDMEPCRWPTCRHGRHVHGRPPGVLAEPADRRRGRRLRRRRPPPGRADRRRRRRGQDRRPGRDDVPPAVHRRRHPQLLLEGPARPGLTRQGETHGHRTASRTRSPSSGWAARSSASTGTRAPTTCSSRRRTRLRVGRRRPRTTSTPTGSAPRSRA